MNDIILFEVEVKPKIETSRNDKVQEVNELFLKPPQNAEEDNEHETDYDAEEENEQHTDFDTEIKIERELEDAPNESIPVSSPMNICHVSLTEAGMLIESGDIIQHSLDGNSAIQLEDGTTAFVENFEASDECDIAAKFIDGQAVRLEDGSTAFLHAAPREGLQAVQLEDGTMAYLSQTGTDLFDGEASSLGLDNLESSQIGEGDEKDMDIKMSDSFCDMANSHTHGKAFQCPYEDCHRLYTTLHHLRVHERSHTGDRPFKCMVSTCGKAFATGYGLKSHTRVHTGETPYRCQEGTCEKAFKTSGDLQKHVRTHTGERPFKCPFNGCNRAFTTSNIRKVHIRTHTGERPYICKMEGCGRAFASATNYKNHIRIHTGEKPYACTVSGCNKRFTEYSSLYKHHVVHTHSKPYICTICKKTYRQTSTLAMHKRSAHGIVDSAEDASVIASAVDKELGSEDIATDHDNVIDDEQCEEDKVLVIKGSDKSDESDGANVSISKTFPTIVTLQADQGSQILHEHSIYAVQLQQDGSLPSSMQQILLVTDPAQLAALQQLTQAQFENTSDES